MSEEKAVEKRYNKTVSSLLREAKIYRRKCSKCKGTGVCETINDADCPSVCAKCEGGGYRYSMGGKKQPPFFARITVANMAKRSIVPYLNRLNPSAVKRVKNEVEKEIDDMVESFKWVTTGAENEDRGNR